MKATLEREQTNPDRQRKRNSDLGSIRFSERDERLLGLIGEQYAISVEQLGRLMGRTHRTARWLRDRWRGAGWVESRRLTATGPSMIWLTPEGARVSGSPFRVWRPNVALAAHLQAVTDVRILLEHEQRLGIWQCERSLAHISPSRGESRPHLPDGLLETAGKRVAIEVELTLKSKSRLAGIVAELRQGYDEVWYFAVPSLQRTLTDLAGEAPWPNVTVRRLPMALELKT